MAYVSLRFTYCNENRIENPIKPNATRRCLHCGARFSINLRGRKQLYCRPSHRVRAHEKRKILETAQPSEKWFRLLKERLASLARRRNRSSRVPGLDEIRRYAGLSRPRAYQQAVDKVRELLLKLAPEVLQDLSEPWRGTITGIEANR